MKLMESTTMNRFLYLLTAAILIVTGLAASPMAHALSITRNGDPQALIQALLGPGVTVIGTPTLIGTATGAGLFINGTAAIGIDSGIVFSSGYSDCALGNNTNQLETLGNTATVSYNNCSDRNGGPSVPDIANSDDASGLEFQFQLGDGSQSGTVFVSYVFGSDEYIDFVGSGFNDAFVFSLDGTNIATIVDPFFGFPLDVNVALINPNDNSHLYRNNVANTNGFPVVNAGHRLDGFTTVLTARADIGPGVHTMRMVIADVRDSALDSVVFLQGGSFSNAASYNVTATVSGGNGSVSCTPASVTAGASSTCTAVPNAGYQVLSWGGDCATAGSAVQCTLNNVQAHKSATVSFVAAPPSTYSVSATVSSGSGSVSCTPASVSTGGSAQCTAVPGTGDQVVGWTGACASAGTNVQCSLTNIQANQTSTVSFSASVTGGNGSVSCSPTTVSKGGNSTCTAVPDAGYQVAAWTDACASWGSNNHCYLSKIRADQAATVSFAPIPPATYNVSATVTGGNGSVSCSPTSVTAGDNSACTAVPDAGYQVQSWSGACATAGSNPQCNLTNLQADQSSTVRFSALPVPTFTISATVSGGNGTVSCAPSPVPQGDSSSCDAVPNPGYQVASWTGACAASGQNVHCALSNVQADQTSTVSFTLIPPSTYHVSASVVLGHGSVSCTPNTVTSGGNSTCTAVPDPGYQVANWDGDCAGWGTQSQCYLTKIKADQTATVSFAPLPPANYTVSASVSGGNGHVSCTPTTVTAGDSSSCTAVPDAGWAVQIWGGDCASAGSSAQCNLTNIQANQSATVSFAALPVPTYAISASVDGGNGSVSCAPSTVPQGDSASCTAVPAANYQVAAWTGACAATGHTVHCALSNIQADQTSTVRFEPIPPTSYTVSATVTGGHGAVSCTPGTVTAGGASRCTAVPDPGYRVQAWGGDCAAAGSQTQCALSAIRANQVATVSFLHALPGSYQVSATVASGLGSVSCSPTTVAKGAASTCTATPNAGYQVQAWGGDCAPAGNSAQCYLPKIQKNQTSTVSFATTTLATVRVSAVVDGGNGSVSCTPSDIAIGGASICTAAPDAGYQADHWDGACLLAGSNPQCLLTNVQSDQRSTIRFQASLVSFVEPETTAIPTLSEWGLLLLGTLLAFGIWLRGPTRLAGRR